MSSNLVIVAVPDENDRVWKVSSEKVPHLTLLFLGDSAQVSNLESIMQFVEHAASTSLRRFYMTVDRRDVLGADEADVLFFKKSRYDFKAIRDFRATLLQDNNIKTAYDSATQFEGPWLPHLTLGYPATPAKPGPNEDDKFYDVSFNKIAIWTGDFEGPEFLLKDYWDEMEALESVPVAMSSIDQERVQAGMAQLEHFGVKGMKWGVRSKTPSVVAKPKNALSTKQQVGLATLGAGMLLNRKVREGVDINNKNMAEFNQDKRWEKDFQKAKGFGFDDQKFTKDYNAKWKDHDFSKEDWSNPSPAYKKYQDGYFKELNITYSKQFADHFGSSPSGKYEAHHEPGTNLVKLRQKAAAQHADQVLVTFHITRDDSGLITGLEQIEDSMAAIHGEEFVLEHFGVKGMKWGVRNAVSAVGRGAKSVGRGLSALGAVMADSAWQGSTYSDVKHEAVHNHVAKGLDNHVERLQRSPKYRGKDLKTDSDLRKTYYQDVAKVTNSAYRRAVKETYGENYTGTKSAHYANDARGQRIEVRDKKTGEVSSESPLTSMKDIQKNRAAGVTHAATTDFPDLTIDLTIDANGQISGVGFVRPSETMAQTAVHGEAFVDSLVHFGIKGMKWGVRKPPPAPVTATATSRVPHGAKRKTKLQVEGGENHPAHEDAVKVAEAKAKLAKSGPAALSNKELRDVANRVQLEQQVKQLVQPKGKKFVKKLLGQQGNQAANEVVGRQVKKKLATAALI